MTESADKQSAAKSGGAAGDPTTAFMLLCIVVGPAIGFVLMTLFASSRLMRPADTLLDAPSWVYAYVIGFPFAVASAGLFLLFAKKLRQAGILSAIAAALIPAILFALANLVQESFIGRGVRWSLIESAPLLAAVSVIAMIGCWCLARALRILT